MKNNMKVEIMQRSVYHKIAVIEIDIPDNIDPDNVQDYLHDNEELYIDKIDDKMSEAKYEFGFGTDYDANCHYNTNFNEKDQESEWRFEVNNLKYGGHL